MKNTERFSDRVENYIRYRPHYPAEIIPFLKKKIGLKEQWNVADVGSGTGISAELFLHNGNRVYAVEPNKEMREAAEAIYKKDKNFISVNGTAEATSLQSNCIDLIISGQAFHWFDKINAKKEFQRIAAPGANLVLIWNDRDMKSDFQKAYEEMLREFALNYEEENLRKVNEKTIREFFSPKPYFIEVFQNSQSFEFEGLKGRLLSSSYTPLEHHPNYKPMLSRLEQIFEEYRNGLRVEFEYFCNMYYGKILN